MSRSTLLLFRRTPYGNSLARAGLDLALANAAFEAPVSVLFTGEGVLQLLHQQDTTLLGDRNYAKTLSSLPLYGVETFYVDQSSLDRHGIDETDLKDECQVLDAAAVRSLIADHDHLVSF